MTPQSIDRRSILAFVNSGSGGRQGEQMMRLLQKLIGTGSNIVDLVHGNFSVRNGVRFPFDELEGVETDKLVVLSCGGDGTHHWVLAGLSEFYGPELCKNGLRVVPVPLGSGNDLSNALGWGQSLSAEEAAIKQLLNQMQGATEQQLDRWTACFDTARQRQHDTGTSFEWQNYFVRA